MQFCIAAAPPHTAIGGFVGLCGGAGLVVARYSLAVSLQTVLMLQQGCLAHARDSKRAKEHSGGVISHPRGAARRNHRAACLRNLCNVTQPTSAELSCSAEQGAGNCA